MQNMSHGLGTWAQARAEGVEERTIDRQRQIRDAYYQEYLRTEAIEIDGVVEALTPYTDSLPVQALDELKGIVLQSDLNECRIRAWSSRPSTPPTHRPASAFSAVVARAIEDSATLTVRELVNVALCDVIQGETQEARQNRRIPKNVAELGGHVVTVKLGEVTVLVAHQLLDLLRDFARLANQTEDQVHELIRGVFVAGCA